MLPPSEGEGAPMASTGSGSGRGRATSVHRVGPPLLTGALVLATYAVCRPSLIDDAYISFRYADNVDHGHGLVFNAGERVEGVSNALWTLTLAAAHALGLPFVGTATVLGVAGAVAVALLTPLVARTVDLPPTAAVLCGFAVALSTSLVSAATMGLEGGLFGALLLASVLALSRSSTVGLGAAVLGLAATRPEGLLLGTGLAVVAATTRGGRSRERAPLALAALAPVVVVEGVRYAYFGQLLPNSVLAKRDVGYGPLSSVAYHARSGVSYVVHALGLGVTALCLLVGVAWLVRGGAQRLLLQVRRRALPPSPVSALVVTLVLGLAAPVLNGGDWMPYGRFVTPYLPLVVVLLVRAAWDVVPTARTGQSVAWLAALLVLLTLLSPHDFPLRDGGRTPLAADTAFDDLGRALGSAGVQGPVATDVLGRVSFQASGVRFLDPLGLTEKDVAATPGRGSVVGKRNDRVIAAGHPAVLASDSWPTLEQLRQACQSAGEQFAGVTSTSMLDSYVFVFVEQGEAATVATALSRYFPGAHVVGAQDAVRDWDARYPDGRT